MVDYLIRSLREDELEDMLLLTARSYNSDVETFRRIYEHDPFYSFDLTRVAESRGRLIGYLRAAPREIWIGPGRIRMGGIAEVCTAPEHRGRGIARALLKSMIPHLANRGYPVSMLYGSAAFYGRLGWERSMIVHGLRTTPSTIGERDAPGDVREFRDADLPKLMSLYDSRYSGRSCAMVRSEEHWRGRILKRTKIKIYDDGDVKGYLAESLGHEGPEGFRQKVLRIMEAGFEEDGALDGILSYLSRANVDKIAYPAVPGDPLLAALQVPGSETHIGWDGMFRVNDVEAALGSLMDACPDFAGRLGLTISDQFMTNNSGHFILDGSGGVPTLSRGRARNSVRMNIQALSQLVPGTHSASEMAAMGRLEVSSGRAKDIAEEIFPRRFPFQPPADHF